MSKYVITNNFKLHAARQFAESITEAANTAYYLFAAKHIPFTSSIPTPYDTVKSQTVDIYRDMMYGKRVTAADITMVIDRYDWESGTVYDIYDDTDTTLKTKQFYTVVNAGSYSHVWKCIDNHNGANSTVQPNFGDIDSADEVYETSDKYRWKYMYSVTSSDVAKFGTLNYFPVVPNTDVRENAVKGAIDFIKVVDAGEGYDNYLSNTFSTADIRLNGNNLTYGLPATASAVNDFYNDCILYISSGTGAGQFREILTYFSNSTHKVAVVNGTFSPIPASGSEYEIYPKVSVLGDGTEMNVAIGRAIVNSSGNTIDRVEMMNRGSDYKYAVANLHTSNVVGVVTNASLRVIQSPRYGHGYDPEAELYAHRMCISVKLANSESNTIPTKNDINQIGLLKDPLFANVELELVDGGLGIYQGGESVYKVEPQLIKANATVSLTSNAVSATDADFENQFDVGDYVMIEGDAEYMLSIVTSVTNSSHLRISTNSTMACTSANIYYPNITTTGNVSGYTTGIVSLNYVSGTLETNNFIIGGTSGAYSQINSISRSDVTKGFNTFVGMYCYRVEMTSGTFSQNEKVFSPFIEIANASVHSILNLGSGIYRVYVTNQLGIFNIGETLSGANSGAEGNILNKYSPEIHYNTGEVLYIENLDSVTRAVDQTETFKLIYEF